MARGNSIARTPSLRDRLTVTYAVALTAGLCVFAAFSLAAIDHTLRVALDARMSAAAQAISTSLTVRQGRIVLDRHSREALLSILGAQENGAIVLDDGRVAMESAKLPSFVRTLGNFSNVHAATFATLRAPNSPLRVVATPVTNDGASVAAVVVWRPVDFIRDYEQSAAVIFSVTAVVVVSLSVFVGAVIAKRGLEPLRAMAAVASEIEAHDLSRRFGDTPRSAELDELCTTFDRMLDRIQGAFERERQFTADASHDLRAPLAVILAEAELALRDASAIEQRTALLSIRSEAQELDELVDAMLRVARAEECVANSATVDLSELTLSALARMEKLASTRGVQVVTDVERNVSVRGDMDLLESAVSSLLHNAIKFTPSEGRVEARLFVTGASATLVIRDSGPGFSKAALDHAFDRFWRGDAARGRSGSGLGLGIAKASFESFGGSIELENAAFGGAVVTVRMPLQRTTRNVGT